MPVPLMDIRSQYAGLLDEVKQAVCDVIDSGVYILGPNMRALEEEVAATVGAAHGVAVANGTDALVLSLEALGIGRGDEVITTAYTFYATAEAIARVGATPVFADIDRATFNLDPAAAVDGGAEGLGGILDQRQTVPVGHLSQRGHVRREAVQVHGEDRRGLRGEGGLDGPRVDQPRVIEHVAQHRRRADMRHGQRRGDEGVTGHDDLVAGADAIGL